MIIRVKQKKKGTEMKKSYLLIASILVIILLISCSKSKGYTEFEQRTSINETNSRNAEVDITGDEANLDKVGDSKSPEELEIKIDSVHNKQTDDWLYSSPNSDGRNMTLHKGSSSQGGLQTVSTFNSQSSSLDARAALEMELPSDAGLGLSVGGAKDINNFRENIEKGYMPIQEDITHEGIFYDYFFDNNSTKEATHLFEPAYTSYRDNHPLTDEDEIYLSVGLNSNLTQSSFERKKLNLVIVLDISGSMSSSFDQYYYDKRVRELDTEKVEEDRRAKIEIAKECIVDLTRHLEKDDRFAMVLYDNQAYLAKPFRLVGETDMDAIRLHIEDIYPRGGTNMYAGINTASELYNSLPEYDTKEYDNRIIFLTDAMPNSDVTEKNTLWGVMQANADRRIYSTFIGVGVDLNSKLINYISKTPGANYYAVHNAQEFKQRMDKQFDFMVTPLVFDLTLYLKSDDYKIAEVYGSPEANKASGEIMRVNTLFPSESSKGQTRGGIILIKLIKIGEKNNLELECSYKDRNGIPELVRERINLLRSTEGSNNGVRKAVLLARYVDLMHDWINDKRDGSLNENKDDWQFNNSPAKPIHPNASWERNSRKLEINSFYKELFTRFQNYFAKEATEIDDADLRQELDILDILTK